MGANRRTRQIVDGEHQKQLKRHLESGSLSSPVHLVLSWKDASYKFFIDPAIDPSEYAWECPDPESCDWDLFEFSVTERILIQVGNIIDN